MRTFLPPSILSILLPTTLAKHIPIRARQAAPASTSAPTSTPAVLILQQNPGCCLLSSALSICESLTPEFTALAPSKQASCLCYSSTVWAPDIFDGAVKTCADFASKQLPFVYAPIASLENFCSNVGYVSAPGSASANITSIPSNSACNLVNSLLEVCTSLTPGFASLSATNQASCLCYVSTSTWVPTIFDNAVSTCKDFNRTAERSMNPIVRSLDGFCSSVGDIMSTGAVATTTMATITTISPLRPSATAGSVASKTSSRPTTSIDLTITIGGTATNTATVLKNGTRRKIVSEGQVIGVSFACAVVLLFLC